jgi:CubicO group peptidase (beta-lactamase class C family)
MKTTDLGDTMISARTLVTAKHGGTTAAERLGIMVLITAVLVVLFPPADAAGAVAPARDDWASRVDLFVSAYLDRTGLPGASVAITHGSQVVYVAGYGHDATGAAITGMTRMPVASLSKSVTALAVLQLADAGQIDLDAPVHRYLSDFWLADPRGARITVRQLLNQTSGMADTAFPDLRRPQADSLAGAVTRLHDADLAGDPGTEFHYHNPNYQVAARLVEVVSGEPFADYLRQQVFAPIGMADTTTTDTTGDVRALTHGYIRAYGLAIPAAEPDWFVGGSAGVITTAADLARWLITQDDGRTPDGHQVVSLAAITVMHTPSAASGDYYGMGWERRQPGEISHDGEWFTYTAQQILLPGTGYGVAVIADTGMSLEDDSAVIAQGLVALTRNQPPDVTQPAGTYADWVVLALTLITAALAVLGLVRSRRWAIRRADRPVRLSVLRLLPLLVPAVLFALLPEIGGVVFGGRSGTFLEATYVWLALVVWLGTAAPLALAVLGTRGVRLVRLRRRSRAPHAHDLTVPFPG